MESSQSVGAGTLADIAAADRNISALDAAPEVGEITKTELAQAFGSSAVHVQPGPGPAAAASRGKLQPHVPFRRINGGDLACCSRSKRRLLNPVAIAIPLPPELCSFCLVVEWTHSSLLHAGSPAVPAPRPATDSYIALDGKAYQSFEHFIRWQANKAAEAKDAFLHLAPSQASPDVSVQLVHDQFKQMRALHCAYSCPLLWLQKGYSACCLLIRVMRGNCLSKLALL